MELWIAKGNKKELKKKFSYLRDFAVIDIREVASVLGYETSVGLDVNASYILFSEIKKRLLSLNNSRRFYRVLYLVESYDNMLPFDLMNFSIENKLKYDIFYSYNTNTGDFELVCEVADFESPDKNESLSISEEE
jgi:hypothetical protein